jgi:parvulin-like peptidyl-prolyl isomerase
VSPPRALLAAFAILAGACAASSPPPPGPPPSSRSSGGSSDPRPVLDLAGRIPPPPPPGVADPRGLLPAGDDPVVAEVDGSGIRASDVARFLFRYDPGRALEGLNQLLDARILEADAAAAGIALPAGEVEARTEEEVRRRETDLRVQFGPATTLDAYLRDRFGFTAEAYRKDVAALVRLQSLRDRLVRADALREDRVRVRVLVTRTEDEARDAARRIREGADFAAVAKQSSLAPVEELPPYSRAEIEPRELADELFAMESGEVSRPVRVAREGLEVFQVFKVVEKRPARQGSWADLAEEVERGLRDRAVSPAEYLQWARGARERHGVKVHLEEPAAGAAEGSR